jgi:putative DNA primase/helicase
MTVLTSIFPGGFAAPEPPPLQPPEIQLRVAIAEYGLTPPDELIFDGKLHRFSTNGKPRDMSGWYVAHDGKLPAGAFGDWRSGMESTWRADIGRELNHVEAMQHSARMREVKLLREKELAAIRENAAHQAQELWDSAPLASDEHPYIKRKGVTNPGWRLASDGRLMAPVLIDGEVVSLQYIDADGGKLFAKGGKVGGGWWSIGGQPSEIMYLVEGVATAASVFEATGKSVGIAYSAGNLTATATALRAMYPSVELVIVADRDESGTGEREAKRAADIVSGVRVVVSPVGDANDYAQGGGDLVALLNPVADAWLIPADEFSAQPAPIAWLVKRWVQDKALVMVHGPSGGGKTFVVLDWCLRMASGMGEWCGQKVKQGGVVYLAGEGHHGLRSRIAAWKSHHGAGSLTMWLSKNGCDLNTADGYIKVVSQVKALQERPQVIVVDTLHRFLLGDENSAQDAKTMLDACNALMHEFDCTVILVHHTGVSEDAQHRARGSSAWRGALDIEISIIPAANGKPMQVVQRKSKDAEMAEPVCVELKQVEIPGWIDEDGAPVTSAIVIQLDGESINDVSPVESKSLAGFRKYFEDAIIASGRFDSRIGKPFISTDSFNEFSKTKPHESDGARRVHLSNVKKKLVEAGYAEVVQGGYVATDHPMMAGAFIGLASF